LRMATPLEIAGQVGAVNLLDVHPRLLITIVGYEKLCEILLSASWAAVSMDRCDRSSCRTLDRKLCAHPSA